MKKRFINFCLLLFCVLSLLPFTNLQATHGVGSDMTYICDPQNPCLVTLRFRFVRNCSSNANGEVPSNLIISGCNHTVTTGVTWVEKSRTEITPLCVGQNSNCTVPTSQVQGVQQVLSEAVVDFCANGGGACSAYYLEWSLCCRESGITSLVSSATQSIGASFPFAYNPTVCNSSPKFSTPPFITICNNQINHFSQGAIDPEGNTLRYAMGACYQNTEDIVNYAPLFSGSAPLGPTWDVTINSVSGQMTFTPVPGGVLTGVVCVVVTQYDANGVAIGKVMRDMEVRVVDCDNGLPTLSGPYEIEACVGQQTCFTVTASDPDPLDILSISVVSNTAGATVTISNTQPPSATICVTPTVAGNTTVVLEVKDNHCPMIGKQQFTYTIKANDCNPCGEYDASFTATQSRPCSFSFQNTSTPDHSTISWNFGDGGVQLGGNTASHVYSVTGFVTVVLTVTWHPDGFPNLVCTDTYSQTYYVNCGKGGGDRIGQAPVLTYEAENALLRIRGSNPSETGSWSMELFDLQGKHLQSTTVAPGEDGKFDLSAYANGLYFVRMMVGTHAETIKFMKY